MTEPNGKVECGSKWGGRLVWGGGRVGHRSLCVGGWFRWGGLRLGEGGGGKTQERVCVRAGGEAAVWARVGYARDERVTLKLEK